MGHPSSLYIKYLAIKGMCEGLIVSNPERLSSTAPKSPKKPTAEYEDFERFYDQEVTPSLLDFDLPLLTSIREFYRITKDLKDASKLKFMDVKHTLTARYMREAGVYQIWNPNPEEAEVFRLLKKSVIKDSVKILLIGSIPPMEVSSYVTKKFKTPVSMAAVSMFNAFFWNVESVSRGEWNNYLANASLKDHLIASLVGGPGQALYRAGFNPSVDGVTALKDLQRALYYRIDAAKMLPDNERTANVLTKLSRELMSVNSILYGEGAGLEDTLKKFQEFKMELKRQDAIPIMELAPKGNYSNSGIKEKADERPALYASPRVGKDN